MAHLLADENFPRPVTAELRRRGHDVIDMEQLGLTDRSISDAEVLDIAARDGRTVLTLDRRDFARLHRDNGQHGGIVACTLDLDFIALATRIDVALSSRGRLDGHFISVIRPGPVHL
jgi:hypothetical protein